MKKTLAHIFSWLFLPLLMPFYGLYLSLYIPSEELSLSGQGMYQIPLDHITILLCYHKTAAIGGYTIAL